MGCPDWNGDYATVVSLVVILFLDFGQFVSLWSAAHTELISFW